MHDGGETYRVVAPVTRAGKGRDAYYFARIGGDVADQIRFDALSLDTKARRSVRVVATVNDIEWSTSLFVSGDEWVLPLKLDVRRRAGIGEGDQLAVALRLGVNAKGADGGSL
jgi:hypothetical protein